MPVVAGACLETLLLDLGLRGLEGGGRVGVDETTARLAVLRGRGLGAADADLVAAAVGRGGAARAAVRLTVRVVDAPAGRELLALAVADVASARVVGGQRECGEGDCGRS